MLPVHFFHVYECFLFQSQWNRLETAVDLWYRNFTHHYEAVFSNVLNSNYCTIVSSIITYLQTNDEERQYPSIKRNTPVNVSSRYKDTKTLPIDKLRISKSESSFSSSRPLEDNAASMASLDTLDQASWTMTWT